MRRAGAGRENRRWNSRYQGSLLSTVELCEYSGAGCNTFPGTEEGNNLERWLYAGVMGDTSQLKECKEYRGFWDLRRGVS